MSLDAVFARMSEIVGARYAISGADPAAEPYLREWRGLWRGQTRLALRPESTAQVSAILALASAHGIPVTPQGGATGLCGGAVGDPDGVILSLDRMTALRALDPVGMSVTADAGRIVADLQADAAAAGLLFPLSLASEGSCRIGGCLSTNAGGMNVLKYGNARDLCLGLEVVLPDGRVLDGLSPLRKNNTGYDWKQLFIGGEGTLGVITAASCKLFPALVDSVAAFIAVPEPEAATALLALARARLNDSVYTFELMSALSLEMVRRHFPGTPDPLPQAGPWYVLLEAGASSPGAGLGPALEEMLGEALEQGWALDAAIAQNVAQARAFRLMRENISDAQKPEGASIKHDVSVPVGSVGALVRRGTEAILGFRPDARPVIFGHVGDGNLHFNISQPVGADPAAFLALWEPFNRLVHDVVADLGGSFSAEHGIGKLKVEEMRRYKSVAELDLMRAVKSALDPRGVMNPGKLAPPPG